MKRAIKVTLVIFAVLLVIVLAAIFYYLGITGGEKLDPEKLTLNTSCVRLFDGNGNEIETGGTRNAVSLHDLPKALPNAFVAVEDKSFYKHNGFDYKRIVKAAMKNVATFSFREGASTISQQLVKNTHLSGEKTINRKLKEFKLTRALERRYSKEEIMELYLNSIYFGHSAFGVNEAAHFYFGKRAEELTPAECAMLAALVKSPNRYSPFRNADKCLARRNLVLKLMNEQNYLSETEYRDAVNSSLPESPAPRAKNAYLARVYEELDELFPDLQASGDLRVYTFYDPDLQAELDKTQMESDACILVRDNDSHGIKALHATAGTPERLPASVIKPLLVYAPAFEENMISPLTPVLDKKTDFGGYSPDDYKGASGGYVSVRQAVAKSLNIPAVRILNELGVERGAKYLKKMKLEIPEEDYSLALALGGMKNGFTLPALADGYATFANGGNFAASRAVSRVEDGRGRTLFRFTPLPTRIFSEDTSYLMNDVLQTAVKSGTAKTLSSLPFPICGKTGTGGTEAGNTDAYTISYTRRETVAVWLGNRDNSPIKTTGGGFPANLALRVYKYLYRNGSAPEPFEPCDSIVSVEYDIEEYETNHRILLADPLTPVYAKGSELFRKSALPEASCERFSRPTIEKPLIFVQNNAVSIELCQTKYYEYIIKRENRGKITTIYSGKYQKNICDNSVRGGESYRYTVVPVYNGTEGTPVELPLVYVPVSGELPDDWWE